MRTEPPAAEPRPSPADPSLATATRPAAKPASRTFAGERGRGPVTPPLTLSRRPRHSVPRRDIELGKGDQGRIIETRVGEEFLLRLPENPASGYAWQFSGPVDRLLAVVGSAYDSPARADGRHGDQGHGGGGRDAGRRDAGRHIVLRLRGRRAGTATLRMHLTRPWGGEPVDSFEITVRVVEQGDGPHGATSTDGATSRDGATGGGDGGNR